MPPPIKVERWPHSAAWASEATAESARLLRALQDCVVVVHHIGSTAVPGIHAKPIVDVLGF